MVSIFVIDDFLSESLISCRCFLEQILPSYRWVSYSHKTPAERARRDARALELLTEFGLKAVKRKILTKSDFDSFVQKWESFEKLTKGLSAYFFKNGLDLLVPLLPISDHALHNWPLSCPAYPAALCKFARGKDQSLDRMRAFLHWVFKGTVHGEFFMF
jgi:hypothetical protein